MTRESRPDDLTGRDPASPLDALAAFLSRRRRLLYLLAAVLGAASFWISPRPPMSDLPQHAAQVALWRDLLAGSSAFADLVFVNLFTPYLIGYGLALPLAFFVSAGAAVKIVLTFAFLAYLAMAVGLRRDLRGDPRTDWLAFFGYFGVAWVWGFYTFLVAAPLVLLFARVALRHARAPRRRAAFAVVSVAAVLLLSHGLQFLFAGLIGALLSGERALAVGRKAGARAATAAALRRAWPYAAMLGLFIAFMLARRLAFGPDPVVELKFVAPIWRRIPTALALLWDDSPRPLFLALSLIAMAAPLEMGLRPRRGPGLALFAGVLAVELFVFDTAFGTGFVYQRFALYLALFWGLSLRPSSAKSGAGGRPGGRSAEWAHLVLVGCVFVALSAHLHRVAMFAREDATFDAILDQTRPGERILALAFDTASPAFGNAFTYLDWIGWLQAGRGAFVDVNFAVYPPQLVRFRDGKASRIGERENWTPTLFDWRDWNASIYDAFLVRGAPDAKARLFLDKTPCAMRAAATAGDWTLYRKDRCEG